MSITGGGSYLGYLSYDSVDESENENADGNEVEAEEGGGAATSSLGFVQRYGKSDNVSERQVAVRHLLKTLQTVENDNDALEIVFNLIENKFSNDPDALIRAELLEALPMLCMHCAQAENLRPRINATLIPLLVKFLSDQSIQVRKTCQAAILILLDQELFESEVLERTIIPVLLQQSEPGVCSDETRIETVTLLCKIVTNHLEQGKAVQLFLDKYTVLCREPLIFHIRKQCASCIGDMSTLLGPELTERVLVPHLISLSQDSVWGVRKACAENFTDVSKNCSMGTRRNKLAPSFIVLLADSSRWVQSSAFQALGQFISTFADSNRTGLKWVNGQLQYMEPSPSDSPSEEPIPGIELCLSPGIVMPHESQADIVDEPGGIFDLVDGDAMEALKLALEDDDDDDKTDEKVSTEDNSKRGGATATDPEDYFSAFRYWQPPLIIAESPKSGDSQNNVPNRPFITTSDDHLQQFMGRHFQSPFANGGASSTNESYKSDQLLDPLTSGSYPEERGSRKEILNKYLVDKTSEPTSDESDSDDEPLMISIGRKSELSDGDGDTRKPQEDFEYQDIIPRALLENYLSMVEPTKAQSVESDIARHCAYNLPAVAYTMGRQNWSLIQATYTKLANDIQWKVRRTLAFSLHELAAILGHDLTVRDLMPVFSSFLRDLDEVRVGILKYLHDFIKLLDQDVRRKVLKDLGEFLTTDNNRNWRFRYILAEQLTLLCELYGADDINEYLSPIAMTLATDRVAEIRRMAYRLLASVLAHFWIAEGKGESGPTPLTDKLITEIIKAFAQSQRFFRRQSFAYICHDVLETGAVSDDKFTKDLLPILLQQADDTVPNVRIVFLQSLQLFFEIHKIRSFTDEQESSQRVDDLVRELTDRDSDWDVKVEGLSLLNLPLPKVGPHNPQQHNHELDPSQEEQEASHQLQHTLEMEETETAEC